MTRKLVYLLLAWSLCQSAYGFQLVVHEDGPVLPRGEVVAAVNRIAGTIRHGIPNVPQLKVVVTTQSKLREQEGKFLYYHRIQLTKVFEGGPPYPYKGWLPIQTVQRYGLASKEQVREDLETALSEFFRSLQTVDPATAAP